MLLLLLGSFERLLRVLTPSCAAPFTTLQGAPFESLALPSRWTESENAPLYLAQWQPLTMRTILFDTGQTPKTFYSPMASCWLNTPVQLQRELNTVGTGRKGRWLERQLDDGEVQVPKVTSQKKKKSSMSLLFAHKIQQAVTAECQWGMDVNNVTHDIILERGGHASVNITPQEIFCYFMLFVAPPPAVISFYNQRMQIGICWQPINQILSAICWAARHVPVDTSTVNFLSDTQIYHCTTGIWDPLGTFHFHQVGIKVGSR